MIAGENAVTKYAIHAVLVFFRGLGVNNPCGLPEILVNIGSDNDLGPLRRVRLPDKPHGTYPNEIIFEIQLFLLKNIHCQFHPQHVGHFVHALIFVIRVLGSRFVGFRKQYNDWFVGHHIYYIFKSEYMYQKQFVVGAKDPHFQNDSITDMSILDNRNVARFEGQRRRGPYKTI